MQLPSNSDDLFLSKEELEKIRTLITYLRERDEMVPFLIPVLEGNITQRIRNKYKKEIETPMDLRTITEKLERNEYKTVQETINDIMLIWDNCKKFNLKKSDYYQYAEILESYSKDLVQGLFPEKSNEIVVNKAIDIEDKGVNKVINEEENIHRVLSPVKKVHNKRKRNMKKKDNEIKQEILNTESDDDIEEDKLMKYNNTNQEIEEKTSSIDEYNVKHSLNTNTNKRRLIDNALPGSIFIGKKTQKCFNYSRKGKRNQAKSKPNKSKINNENKEKEKSIDSKINQMVIEIDKNNESKYESIESHTQMETNLSTIENLFSNELLNEEDRIALTAILNQYTDEKLFNIITHIYTLMPSIVEEIEKDRIVIHLEKMPKEIYNTIKAIMMNNNNN